MNNELQQCPVCEGCGRVPLGKRFVTRDMALDACAPAMEGMSLGIEWGDCDECGGSGTVETPESLETT